MKDQAREPERAVQDTAADGTAVQDTAVEDTAVQDTAARDAAVQDTAADGAAVRDTAADRAGEHSPRPGQGAATYGDVHQRPGEGARAGASPGGAPALPELDVEELRDRWQRAVAEMENLRKRYERQLEEVRRTERDRVTAAWLPVVDHLELALQHAAADPKAIVAGVEAVCQQAYAVLAHLGYRRIADLGEPFDPARHEAAQVREEPAAAPGSVVQVLRPGYGSDSGLLRPAVVSVAAKPDE
ncbi:nucleotide exchange factor GrpE [Streptomyces ficellus]|uniref:Protein GrpE n=1 Tax=Streptomyces ficellus TaxID=1977088 RepID=A0ABT7Z4B2_9ACTN|nr:nucleotide exchange factor GrpE [Streptomyces ficellus]MDN3294330.1 nucleotide exchange factor GrpE [Streptomyces ficellus]